MVADTDDVEDEDDDDDDDNSVDQIRTHKRLSDLPVEEEEGVFQSTMEEPIPKIEQVDVIVSDESEGDDVGSGNNRPSKMARSDKSAEVTDPEDILRKRAEMYQDYIKAVPIPIHRGSVIPFTSWTGLGNSVKLLYNQPLHYLTNIFLKKMDQIRIGSEDELDSVIHPCKAEVAIWLIEEAHRLTTSHDHLAKLWTSDPMFDAYIDSIFPSFNLSFLNVNDGS